MIAVKVDLGRQGDDGKVVPNGLTDQLGQVGHVIGQAIEARDDDALGLTRAAGSQRTPQTGAPPGAARTDILLDPDQIPTALGAGRGDRGALRFEPWPLVSRLHGPHTHVPDEPSRRHRQSVHEPAPFGVYANSRIRVYLFLCGTDATSFCELDVGDVRRWIVGDARLTPHPRAVACAGYVTRMPDLVLEPVQPYSLVSSARGYDPTRRMRDGFLELVFVVDETPTLAQVWQRPDGNLGARIDSAVPAAAIEHLRFVLALDVDHGPLLSMADADPLLCDLVSRRRGLRPLRTSTVAHALVQALAGQLITAREARMIEHRIVAMTSSQHAGLWLPPTCDGLRALSAVELARTGLSPRRAAALARVVRTFDVERLRTVPTGNAVARIERERTLGPWSAGVIALYGLGRYEHGLVGDLGLIRLCGNLLGRQATADDTRRLLDRYGDWAGLAGVHLMRHPLARERARRPTPRRAVA